MARVWLTAGAYYVDLDPVHFQLPSTRGLAESFDADIEARSSDTDSLRLVAERAGEAADWLTAHVEHLSASAPHQLVREPGWTRLVVDAVMVDRAPWRQGIGTALLAEAESWGRDRGAAVVRLYTSRAARSRWRSTSSTRATSGARSCSRSC